MQRVPRQISARARILGAILAVAVLGLTFVGTVTFVAQFDRVHADVDERLRTQTSMIRSLSAEGEVADAPLLLRQTAEQFIPQRDENAAAFVGGELLAVPQTVTGGAPDDSAELLRRVAGLVESADGTVIGTMDTDDGAVRYIGVPVADDRASGTYVIIIDLATALRPITASAITYTVATLATLAAIAIVGWFVTGRLLSPIRHMRDTADSITLAELGARIPEQGNDDIADLTRTVNSMLDRLEGSVGVQRQLLDDVQHELKTPITIIRGHLEMMNSNDPTDVEITRQIGITELDRMTRLVDDIDLLAAVEGDHFSVDTVDIGALTRRLGDLVAAMPGHRWRVDAVAHGEIQGDVERLLQAWLQLADNAKKYAPQGSPIELGSAITLDGARLWVRDHGPGVPHASRRHIFRRFDRAQIKRTVGGSGLGLAIVDTIAKAHGGSCTVTETPGGGATFTIHLPSGTPSTLPDPVSASDVVHQRGSFA